MNSTLRLLGDCAAKLDVARACGEFGQPGFELPYQDPRHRKFMDTLAGDLIMAGTLRDIDVVHCHTWYTHLAGCLVKQLTGAPLVLTTQQGTTWNSPKSASSSPTSPPATGSTPTSSA